MRGIEWRAVEAGRLEPREAGVSGESTIGQGELHQSYIVAEIEVEQR
jgi:hypothetical protein